MLRHKLAFRAACPFLLIGLLRVSAAPGQEIHFSPEERLDAIDAQLVGDAKQSIDFASYALTDPIIIDALNAAERRGVAIRIVLDPRERHDFVKLGDLSDNVRIKRGGPFMHLKAYSVDGEMLRTGSANFSTSGGGAFVSRDVSATWRNFQRGAWGNRARPPEPPLPVVGDFPNDFQTLIHKALA